MADEMRRLGEAHPAVARIDGRGLHWTIEFFGPSWREWEGQEAQPLASREAARALEAGVMIATSGEQTSLFIAPPPIVEANELMTIIAALDHGLELADREFELGAARPRRVMRVVRDGAAEELGVPIISLSHNVDLFSSL